MFTSQFWSEKDILPTCLIREHFFKRFWTETNIFSRVWSASAVLLIVFICECSSSYDFGQRMLFFKGFRSVNDLFLTTLIREFFLRFWSENTTSHDCDPRIRFPAISKRTSSVLRIIIIKFFSSLFFEYAVYLNGHIWIRSYNLNSTSSTENQNFLICGNKLFAAFPSRKPQRPAWHPATRILPRLNIFFRLHDLHPPSNQKCTNSNC